MPRKTKPFKRLGIYEAELIADGLLMDYDFSREELKPVIALLKAIALSAERKDFVNVQDICDSVNHKLIRATLPDSDVERYQVDSLKSVLSRVREAQQ